MLWSEAEKAVLDRAARAARLSWASAMLLLPCYLPVAWMVYGWPVFLDAPLGLVKTLLTALAGVSLAGGRFLFEAALDRRRLVGQPLETKAKIYLQASRAVFALCHAPVLIGLGLIWLSKELDQGWLFLAISSAGLMLFFPRRQEMESRLMERRRIARAPDAGRHR